jgi:hypothetical protein
MKEYQLYMGHPSLLKKTFTIKIIKKYISQYKFSRDRGLISLALPSMLPEITLPGVHLAKTSLTCKQLYFDIKYSYLSNRHIFNSNNKQSEPGILWPQLTTPTLITACKHPILPISCPLMQISQLRVPSGSQNKRQVVVN